MNWTRFIGEKKYARLTVIACLVLALDQITKAVVLHTMPLYQSIRVIPGLFSLTHIHNPGGAFGFLARQSPELRYFFFVVISLLTICLVFYFYTKTPRTHPLLADGFALIIGGAIGNMIDRLRFGKVVDFLDFYISGVHWPAFNVADSAITIGMGIFFFHFLFNKLPDQK